MLICNVAWNLKLTTLAPRHKIIGATRHLLGAIVSKELGGGSRGAQQSARSAGSMSALNPMIV
jgi:hypothetical protein